MMTRLEIIRGPSGTAPAIVRHAVRFSRRLREHGLSSYSLPSVVDSNATACKAWVGHRVVSIFPDGSSWPSLLRGQNIDRAAINAQRNRMHAIYLEMARTARLRGFKTHARFHLDMALQERLP